MTSADKDGIPATLRPFLDAIDESGEGHGVNAREFFTSASLDRALHLFGQDFENADPRALMSAWSMYYFSAIIIPATTSIICRNQTLPVRLQNIAIDVDDHGRVCHFCLGRDSHAAKPSDGSRFAPLIDEHLAPMIESCCRRSRISSRVLWNNAAVILDYAISEIVRSDMIVVSNALEEATDLLSGTLRPSLARPYFGTDASGERTRRFCCLRYRLPGYDLCPGICPLPKDKVARG